MRVKEYSAHGGSGKRNAPLQGKKLEMLGGDIAAEVEILCVHVANRLHFERQLRCPCEMDSTDLQLPTLLPACGPRAKRFVQRLDVRQMRIGMMI